MVEFVELRYVLYHLSIWQYLATLEGVVQILVELVELVELATNIWLKFYASICVRVLTELVELRFNSNLLLIWHDLSIMEGVVKIFV